MNCAITAMVNEEVGESDHSHRECQRTVKNENDIEELIIDIVYSRCKFIETNVKL